MNLTEDTTLMVMECVEKAYTFSGVRIRLREGDVELTLVEHDTKSIAQYGVGRRYWVTIRPQPPRTVSR